MAHADAPLRLTEEDDIGREKEVFVVLQGVATEQLRGLCHGVVATGMARPDDHDVVDQTGTEERLP